MTKDKQKHGVLVLLEEGVDILDVVVEGKTRVTIFRDTRDGVYHWYELEFLRESGWEVIFRVGDKKIQEAIDLFTKAKQVVATTDGLSSDSYE